MISKVWIFALSLGCLIPATASAEGGRVYQSRVEYADDRVLLWSPVGIEEIEPDVSCRVSDVEGPASVLWEGRTDGSLTWRRAGSDLVCELPFRRDSEGAYRSVVYLSFKKRPAGSLDFVGHVYIQPNPRPPAMALPLSVTGVTLTGDMWEQDGLIQLRLASEDAASFPDHGAAELGVDVLRGSKAVLPAGPAAFVREGNIIRIERGFTRDAAGDFVARLSVRITDDSGKERDVVFAPGVPDSLRIGYWTADRLRAQVSSDRRTELATFELRLAFAGENYPESGEGQLEITSEVEPGATLHPGAIRYRREGEELVFSRPLMRDPHADRHYALRVAVADQMGTVRVFPLAGEVKVESSLPPPPPVWPWIATAAGLLVAVIMMIRFRADIGSFLFMISGVIRVLIPAKKSPERRLASLSQPAPAIAVAPEEPLPAGSNGEAAAGDVAGDLGGLAKQLESLEELLEDRRNVLGQLQAARRLRTSHLRTVRMPEGWVAEEAALVAVVNKWWDEGAGDRDALRRLAAHIGLSARFYTLPHGTDELQDFSSVEITAEHADEHGGWFGTELDETGDLFLIPADPRYFSGITGRTLVRRLFQGAGERTGNTFQRVYRAARLRRLSGTQFESVAPGILSLRGSPIVPERHVEPPGYDSFKPFAEESVGDELPATTLHSREEREENEISEIVMQLRRDVRRLQQELRALQDRVEARSDAEIPAPGA